MKQFHAFRISVLSFALGLSACSSDPENLAPIFDQANTTIDIVEDTVYQGQITATDETAIAYTVASAANNGIFALESDGSYSYTPNADFFGTETVSVAASDEELTSTASITFNVSNVNDAPVFTNTVISVANNGSTSGVLNFSDVDGDAVTVTLVSTDLVGELTLDSLTGEFTYTAAEFATVDTQFVISYSDGVIAEALTATVNLVPSYVTNEDKHAYYYNSDHSHLKRAQTVAADIGDDEVQEQITMSVAEGYATSGFTETSIALIDGISAIDTRAEAMRDSAKVLQQKGLVDAAKTLRDQSELFYHLFVAEKGIENVSKDDASFFLTLLNQQVDAGDTLAQQNLAFTLELYAAAVTGDEYSVPYGYFLTVFRNNATDFMATYSNNPTEQNRQNAELAIDRFAVFVNAMKKQEIRSNRNGNKGLYYDRLKTFYTATASEFYFRIGAIEKAKEYLAKGMSLYTDVSYDENYTFAAADFAELNFVENKFYLADYAGLFEVLYPEAESNFAMSLLEEGTWDYDDALEGLVTYRAYNDILAGVAVDTALAPVLTYYADARPREIFDALIEKGAMFPRIGVLLVEQNKDALAIEVINKMASIINTEDYILAQTTSRYILGYEGCARLTQLSLIAGDTATELVTNCNDIAYAYFGVDKTHFSAERSIDAFIDMMNVAFRAGDNEKITTAATTAMTLVESLDDQLDQLEYSLEIAGFLVTYGQFVDANTVYNSALTTATALLNDETLSMRDLAKVFSHLKDDIAQYSESGTGFFYRHAYIAGMRHGAGKVESYGDLMNNTLTQLATVATIINTMLPTLAVDDQIDVMPDLLMINLHAGQQQQALDLIASENFSDTDRITFNQYVASFIALRDDFPATPIATIDTDNDGKPDFFSLDATQEEIDASGLTLDEDNDNDGISNDVDITPIG